MTTRVLLFISILAILPVSIVTPAWAAWNIFGAGITSDPGQQDVLGLVPDGNGGVIAVWHDLTGPTDDIYAQRLDANGTRAWAFPGVSLSVASGTQAFPTVIADGAGSFIAAWGDYGGAGAVYAQRINLEGTTMWAADGLKVNVGDVQPGHIAMVSDGEGGAIVTWVHTPATDDEVHVQRFDQNGTIVWATNTVACNVPGYKALPAIVTDEAGGAIIAWYDQRDISARVFAQRVDASGAAMWTTNGVALNSYTGAHSSPELIADGTGGAIAVWHENHVDTDVYAQKIASDGWLSWGSAGLPVSSVATDQWWPVLTTDGAGGAIFAWIDDRNASRDIYVQRVGSSGAPRWPADGIPMCLASGFKQYPEIVSDDAGGAIVAWTDSRNLVNDVYAQRVDADGVFYWRSDGVPVCSLSTSDQEAHGMVSDGNGSAIVVWADDRVDIPYDTYAQRLEFRYGDWGRPDAWIQSVLDVPDDAGGKVNVNWLASQRDRLTSAEVFSYSVWRSIHEIPPAMMAVGAVLATSEIRDDYDGPAYRIEQTATGAFYWEFIGRVDAMQLPGYSFTASTLFDSTSANEGFHHYQVIAHSFQQHSWVSAPHAGYSVDDLSLNPPLNLAGWRVGIDVALDWSPSDPADPDFDHYAVYRSEVPGVLPGPQEFVMTSADTACTDTTASAYSGYYYIVAAVDTDGILSRTSNEILVGTPTAVGDDVPNLSAAQLINYPNPFAFQTELRFDLPHSTDVRVEVFDVAGRRVFERRMASMPSGPQTVRLLARDSAGRSLPSGVYFARVTATELQLTRKLVVAK